MGNLFKKKDDEKCLLPVVGDKDYGIVWDSKTNKLYSSTIMKLDEETNTWFGNPEEELIELFRNITKEEAFAEELVAMNLPTILEDILIGQWNYIKKERLLHQDAVNVKKAKILRSFNPNGPRS